MRNKVGRYIEVRSRYIEIQGRYIEVKGRLLEVQGRCIEKDVFLDMADGRYLELNKDAKV